MSPSSPRCVTIPYANDAIAWILRERPDVAMVSRERGVKDLGVKAVEGDTTVQTGKKLEVWTSREIAPMAWFCLQSRVAVITEPLLYKLFILWLHFIFVTPS